MPKQSFSLSSHLLTSFRKTRGLKNFQVQKSLRETVLRALDCTVRIASGYTLWHTKVHLG